MYPISLTNKKTFDSLIVPLVNFMIALTFEFIVFQEIVKLFKKRHLKF